MIVCIILNWFVQKYFEELLRHRDRELQQLKTRFETLKSERENEIMLMENIILELQLELYVENLNIHWKLIFVFFFY